MSKPVYTEINLQKQWTQEEIDLLHEIFPNMIYREMADWFQVSEDHLKMICRRQGLVKQASKIKYKYRIPKEFEAYIKDNYTTKGNVELAAYLTQIDKSGKIWKEGMVLRKLCHLGLQRTPVQRAKIYAKHVENGAFDEALAKARAVTFVPEGKIIKHKFLDGYRYMTKYKGKIIAVGRAIWLHYHGSIPTGYVVRCIDGNHLNFALSNWHCVSCAMHVRLNKSGSQDIVEIEKIITKLTQIINDKET